MADCSKCTSIVIWCLGSSLLIGLTIRDFIPLYNDYNYNNVLARIDIKDEPVERPEVTACLPRYSYALRKIAEWIWNSTTNGTSDCLECDQMKNHGWDVWNALRIQEFEGLSIFHIEGKIATAVVKKLLTFSNSEEFGKYATLNRSNFNWNQPIIDAIRFFLCALDEQSMRRVAWPIPSGFGSCIDTFKISELGAINAEIIDRLSKLAILALSTYTRFAIMREGNFKTINNLLEDRQFFMDNEVICFTLLKNSSTQWFVYTPYEDAYDPPWIRYPRKRPFLVFRDSSVLYSPQRPYSELLYQTDQSRMRECELERIALMYSVTTRVSEGRAGQNCSKERNAARCVLKTRLKLAEDRCGCTPFSFGSVLRDRSNLSRCNETAYSTCVELETPAKLAYDKCYRKCVHTFYAWEQEVYTEMASGSKSLTFGVIIGTGDTNVPFVEFTMTVKDSFEKFLSQIGGIVNLYLGVSGISVCGLIVLAVKSLQKYYMGYRNRSDQEVGRDGSLEMRDSSNGKRKSIEKLLKQVTEDLSNITEQMNSRMEKMERKIGEIESRIDSRIEQ